MQTQNRNFRVVFVCKIYDAQNAQHPDDADSCYNSHMKWTIENNRNWILTKFLF